MKAAVPKIGVCREGKLTPHWLEVNNSIHVFPVSNNQHLRGVLDDST